MKIGYLGAFLLSSITIFSDVNNASATCSRKNCLNNALTSRDKCVEDARNQLGNLEQGPDTYLQRSHYQSLIYDGCDSKRHDEEKQCQKCESE
ncbi:MAG: hypothetical protein K2P93_02920 [Alphaproteobacteria bacterium]|nr:hypothetical protein [Alphaproteobacteria bacterium]